MSGEQEAQAFGLWLADVQVVLNRLVTISHPESWTILDRAALSNATTELLKAAWYLTEAAQRCFTLAQTDDPSISVAFESATGELLELIDWLGGIKHDN